MNLEFNDNAKRVIEYARNEVGFMNHEYIGTEHILLGIAGVRGPSSLVLDKVGIEPGVIYREVRKMVQKDHEIKYTQEAIYTPRARKVVDYASEEAKKLGLEFVGDESLLLGIVRENEGVGCQVLLNLNFEMFKLEGLRELTREVLA